MKKSGRKKVNKSRGLFWSTVIGKLLWLKNLVIRLSWKRKLLLLLVVLGIVAAPSYAVIKLKSNKVTYETKTIEKGNLITSISGSGTITSVNSTNISTKVSGVVSKVYVTNGDKVTKGQKIADVVLDDYAKERQTAAWVSYTDALESVKLEQKNKLTSDIDMWNARQAVVDAQDAYNNMVAGGWNPATHKEYTYNEKAVVEKTLEEAKLNFSALETKYNNSDANISYAKANVAAALRSYQENSATIVSPADGVITDLALAEGTLVSASSTTSSTSGATIVSAQTVGKVGDPNGQIIATVNLSEVDVISVKANQKVTLTMDSYPDAGFTGKVLSVNTSGSVSSGVTNYPVTIILDPVAVEIYPNMAVSVEIITDIKTDVLLLPSSAIQTSGDTNYVQVLEGKSPKYVNIEVGGTNGTDTEVKSGLTEGDKVITSTISAASSSTSTQTTSPFSGIGRSGGTSSTRSNSSSVRIMSGPPGF